MKDIIVMCPTVAMAAQKCKEFLETNNEYVCRFNKSKLLVGLAGGINIYFKGETEGQRALRGTHADVVTIDEFPMEYKDDMKPMKTTRELMEWLNSQILIHDTEESRDVINYLGAFEQIKWE